MKNRMLILEHVAQGEITVDEAVALFRVLVAVETLHFAHALQSQSVEIEIYLN